MRVLSFLLAIVLVQSQAFALSGGPVFTSPTAPETTLGSYSGVLIPTTTVPGVGAAAAIGLFSLTVPQTGLTTGTTAIFLNGRVFNGTITGFADPASLKLSAIVDASTTFTITTVTMALPGPPPVAAQVLTQSVTASARGNLNAKIVRGNTGSAGTATATRLTGSSTLDIGNGQVTMAGALIIAQTIIFTVVGAQQAIPAPVVVAPVAG